MSHLLQMRGLKQTCHNSRGIIICVASFTDAWIETFIWSPTIEAFKSHLLQMRGLKLNGKKTYNKWITSHLLQMRGLKPKSTQRNLIERQSHLLQMRGLKRYLACGEYGSKVASFTDAWIET